MIGLFQDAVNTLTMSPGHYIAIIDSLLETLQMFISEAGTMQSLVDIILKQVLKHLHSCTEDNKIVHTIIGSECLICLN